MKHQEVGWEVRNDGRWRARGFPFLARLEARALGDINRKSWLCILCMPLTHNYG